MSYTDQVMLAILSVCLIGLVSVKHFIKNPTAENIEQGYDRFLLE